MIDQLIPVGLSNACFALLLAIVAMLVGARAKRPHLAHLLWVLVFVRLVMPPIVSVPVSFFSTQPAMGVATDGSLIGAQTTSGRAFDVETQSAIATTGQAPSLLSQAGTYFSAAEPLLIAFWFLGSFCVFTWSVYRVIRFTRLLNKHTEPAPLELQTTAAAIIKQLKLKISPEILTTSAHLSPMVWWTGGKVRVVIPTSLLEEMDVSQWRWVLAHELAHVRRRDYLVRWLEWLACVCFWWNPMVWWAQRNLRAMEEICCDALVVSCLKPSPHTYANSILTAVEHLAFPAFRPPAMASEINSGGLLERRVQMIVSETSNRVTSRWLQACILLSAVAVLPFGVAYAQDIEAIEKRLIEAVSNDELSLEQAGAMMAALKSDCDGKQCSKKGCDGKECDGKECGKKGCDGKGCDGKGCDGKECDGKECDGKECGKKGCDGKGCDGKGCDGKKCGKKECDGKECRKDGHKSRDENWRNAVGKRLKMAVQAGKLTEKQAWAKWAEISKEDRHPEGIKGHYRKMGIDAETVKRVSSALKEAGLEDKQIEKALGGMLRTIHAMRTAGEKFELNPRLQSYFEEEVDLNDEQLELVLKLSRRILGNLKESRDISKEHVARVESHLKEAVAEGKISEEDAQARLEGMKKAMAGRHGNAKVHWEGIKKRIEGAVERGDLTREQADAKYKEIREHMGKHRHGMHSHWEGIKKRIEGAVERGDMTREQADAKYKEIKKKMMSRKGKSDKVDWEAVKQRIEGAVERGDLTREEADAKYQELKK